MSDYFSLTKPNWFVLFLFWGEGVWFKFIFTANKLLTLLNCSNLALLGQFQRRATYCPEEI